MKRNIYLTVIMAGLILFAGPACDPDKITELDNPKYLLVPENTDMSMMFTNILVEAGRRLPGGNVLNNCYLKYYGTFSFIHAVGGMYQFTRGNNDAQWDAYGSEFRMVNALENYLALLDDPLQVNNLARTRIMKVVIVQRLTDFYGDIPIAEAGNAFILGLNHPKYDRQQDIYKWMLETLDQAVGSLSTDPALAARTWGGARDLVYGGDISRWKKFGNSMMLRIAMRASEADPAMARPYVEKAIAGGVITSNIDNWTLPTRDGLNSEKNAYSMYFEGSPSGDPEKYYKLGEFFVDFLNDREDPRRKVIFGPRLNNDITAVTASNFAVYWRNASYWNFDLSQAKGMIHGTQTNPMGLAEYHHTFTSPNPWLWTLNLPHELLTAGEMLYLIAEASLNGWNTGTTANDAYVAAINTSMNKYSDYPALLDFMRITQNEINDYLVANPLGSGDAARLRLAEEMYVHMYMDPAESWFHVRRVNFELPPNMPDRAMPRRHAFVDNERANNYSNMLEALLWLGLSEASTPELEWYNRVWWDK
jgi:hypothetical protein